MQKEWKTRARASQWKPSRGLWALRIQENKTKIFDLLKVSRGIKNYQTVQRSHLLLYITYPLFNTCTLHGTGNCISTRSKHSVPVLVRPLSHDRQTDAPNVGLYSRWIPFLLHNVQLGELSIALYLPRSHNWHWMEPWKEVSPLGHPLQCSEGGMVPYLPAGQTWGTHRPKLLMTLRQPFEEIECI